MYQKNSVPSQKTLKQEKEKVPAHLGYIIKEYSSLSFKIYVHRDNAQRQQDLVASITTNPKLVHQGMLPYCGHDISMYKTPKERNEFRDFLFNEDLKTNWKTIELVSIEDRDLEEKT